MIMIYRKLELIVAHLKRTESVKEEFAMKEYIELVAEGKDLTEEQAKAAMEILLSGEASQAQIGAF